MSELEPTKEEEDKRRFDVELFIVHPHLDPAEITTALGLKPTITHGVGRERRTPSGHWLPGNYRDTRWRYSIRYEVEDQYFSVRVEELVDRLIPYRDFLRQIRAKGGSAGIIVQFLGDGYFGDRIALGTLSKLVDLQLDLEIECFQVSQN